MNASRKVLVVDDDPAVRKSIDRVLTGKGYAVITAETGEEALRKLNEEKYDLVYTDIRMPGISGLEVAEQVKARKPWTPVVIITGYGTDAAQARAKAAGVSSFVHKPLSPEMIEDSARDALAAPVTQVLALPAAAATPEAEPAGSASDGSRGSRFGLVNARWWLLSALACALGVLTKGLIGVPGRARTVRTTSSHAPSMRAIPR